MSTATDWQESTYGDGWPSLWADHIAGHILQVNECADGSWSWTVYVNGSGPHHALASGSGHSTPVEAQRFAEANAWRRARTASGF